MAGRIIRFRNEAFHKEGALATIVARNSKPAEYTNFAYSTLYAIVSKRVIKEGYNMIRR